MSFFRPHKTKPRQFNYIPRHYDPVKEERDRRRRELHGTSTEDDEIYTPGKYIRTQREARDASRGERSGFEGLSRIAVIAVVVVVAMLIFIPRFMKFAERANEEKMAQQSVVAVGEEAESRLSFTFKEHINDIDLGDLELSPEFIQNNGYADEIAEYQNSIGTINIYDDDVEIVDGKRVE